MKAAILSLLVATALVISTNSASALPPRYFNNNSNYNVNSGYYNYYPNYYSGYSYPNNYYSHPGYYYQNGSFSPSTSYYGPSGRGGALHPAPMSYNSGGYHTGNVRP